MGLNAYHIHYAGALGKSRALVSGKDFKLKPHFPLEFNFLIIHYLFQIKLQRFDSLLNWPIGRGAAGS